MNKTNHFKRGQRVSLRDECADIYGGVYGGSPGVVRKSYTDRLGYPLVDISWDKDDWKYSNQPDGTYPADHFELIETEIQGREESMSKDSGSPDDKKLLDFVLGSMGVSRQAVEEAYKDISEDEDYGDEAKLISKKIEESEGYILVVVDSIKADEDTQRAMVYANLQDPGTSMIASRAMISALGGVFDQTFSLSSKEYTDE